MSRRQQLANTVTAGATSAVADATTNVRAIRFAPTDSDDARAHLLNQLAANVAEAQRGATSRNSQSFVAEDLKVGAAGALITITHGLNRRARWRIVDWTSTAGGVAPIIERKATDTQTMTTLQLRSYVAGVATIEVL